MAFRTQSVAQQTAQKKKPYDYQEEAITAVCRGFSEHSRGQLRMAYGTGKTLIGLWIAERLKSKRTLLLFPSLSLLAQTMREWRRNAADDFQPLCVCSDETVANDAMVTSVSEIEAPVTTNPKIIAAFLRKDRHAVVFATYHSSPRIAEALEAKRVPAFDFVIADRSEERRVGK